MNYFDNESKILDLLYMSSLFRICFVNFSFPLLRFFLSIYLTKGFASWINNSANTLAPPDFVCDESKRMLEVMRVDDYKQNGYQPNALESKRYRQIEKDMRIHGKTLDRLSVIINPAPNEKSENSWKQYLNNFSRIVLNHAGKVNTYRTLHPGYKLGFLIFDESAAYVETETRITTIPTQGSTTGFARYYHAPFDKSFQDILLQSNSDFVIWMTPYKKTPDNSWRGLKDVYLIDINKAKRKPMPNIRYDCDKIICLESNLAED